MRRPKATELSEAQRLLKTMKEVSVGRLIVNAIVAITRRQSLSGEAAAVLPLFTSVYKYPADNVL